MIKENQEIRKIPFEDVFRKKERRADKKLDRRKKNLMGIGLAESNALNDGTYENFFCDIFDPCGRKLT